MGRKYQMISADGHVETPPESWIQHLDEEFRPHAPQLIPLRTGGEAWLIEGQPLIPNGQNITGRGPVKVRGGSYFKSDGSPAEGAGDGAQRLREQDEDGIDAEVLFPPVFASRAIEAIFEAESPAPLSEHPGDVDQVHLPFVVPVDRIDAHEITGVCPARVQIAAEARVAGLWKRVEAPDADQLALARVVEQ